jgi:replicative DNA helicase
MATIPDLNGFNVLLPTSIDAEKTILGAVLLDNVAFYEAAERLEADDFSLDSHRCIFLRMAELMDAQSAVDIVTLAEALGKRKEVASVGGVAYLASLTEGLPRRPVIGEYIRIVKDKSLARQVMAISNVTMSRAADQSEPAAGVVTAAIESMEDSLARGGRRGGREIKDGLVADLPRFEAEMRLPKGGTLGAELFTPELNRITCGIQEGELCLLCARPHQGKTEAAIQAAIANAERGLRVHIQSLEMKEPQLLRRMIRLKAQIPVSHMRDLRCLTWEERQRVNEARDELADLPIFIDDTHELTTQEYRSRCVLAAKRWKADLIIADYVQLLLVPKAKNALEEAKKQAETVRHIARDYCRTLALAQLRRAPPNDLNQYPDIEMIYGSSSFEQAAQIILMLHRTREKKKYTGEDYCFLAKMRELQSIEPLGITAERWGAYRDRYTGEQA